MLRRSRQTVMEPGQAPVEGTPAGQATPVTNAQTTNGQVTNGQTTNGQTTSGQVTNGQVTNGQVTNGQVTNGLGENGQARNGQVATAAPVTTAAPVVAAAPVATASPMTTGPVYEEPLNPGATRALFGIGALTFLLGAWAAIVPFVGPVFGYNATGTKAWVWSLSHALLWLAPGALAGLIGLVLMSRASLVAAGLSRAAEKVMGLIVVICGAWLVIGPLAWPVIEGRHVFVKASPFRELVNQIGYSLGTGVLLAALGGAVIGAVMLVERGAVPAHRFQSTARNSTPMAT